MTNKIEDFYHIMLKREDLRIRKEAGASWPWSNDKILNEYKFTNVKREHDRTTKWMRKNWTRPNDHKPGVTLFNCALFRYFGTIEFAQAIGWQTKFGVLERERIKRIATKRLANKERVFTGAYVITNQGMKSPKQEVVVEYFLNPLWHKRNDLAFLARMSRSWKKVAEKRRTLPGFGGTGFMTKEVLQDAIHTSVFGNGCIDRDAYCPVGPGARRGLNRIYGRDLKSSASEGLAEMIKIFQKRSLFWPKEFVELELHDIQFQLCEYDKYQRVLLGEGRPRSKYRHVDQQRKVHKLIK